MLLGGCPLHEAFSARRRGRSGDVVVTDEAEAKRSRAPFNKLPCYWEQPARRRAAPLDALAHVLRPGHVAASASVPRRAMPQFALRSSESAASSTRRALTPQGTPRRPRSSTEPSGTASRRRFERRPLAHVYVSVVPGYAFIHRRRVLSVFSGKGRGRAEENGSRRWRSLSSL